MHRLIQCSPKFSEGRSKEIIEEISSAIEQTDGCTLLDIDAGVVTHQTVYTFVGSPSAVVYGALNATRAAKQLIDMASYSGEFPRLGLLDICPFIPVQNSSMEDAVRCAEQFSSVIAEHFEVPVYLYGEVARSESRRQLPKIREINYSTLEEKLNSDDWQPDFGPAKFVSSWGATAVGARKPILVFNVNILSTLEQAEQVAKLVMESDPETLDDNDNKLKQIEAIGRYLDEGNVAQVATIIRDHDVTPLHTVFEEIKRAATAMNLPVTGSQLVGVVPLEPLMQTAKYYIEKESLFVLETDQRIRLVIDRLGLSSLGLFNPKERVIECMTAEDSGGPLQSMDVSEFIMTVGSRSRSPGSSSVSTTLFALGTSLSSMSAFMSYGYVLPDPNASVMRELLPNLFTTTKTLMPYIDATAMSLSEFLEACELSSDNEDETKRRDEIMDATLKNYLAIVLNAMKLINELWPNLSQLAETFDLEYRADFSLGVKTLDLGMWGCGENLTCFAEKLKDVEYKNEVLAESELHVSTAKKNSESVLKTIKDRIAASSSNNS